ncbi:hypothetical protein [Sphaerisporangium dianthi]|uniref:Peptidase MA-like domain-containing protein n=1 Tax=Sphaerisporangium dianthi TaxID=1436120 RepID=A0ABV9CDF8_9ACTN
MKIAVFTVWALAAASIAAVIVVGIGKIKGSDPGALPTAQGAEKSVTITQEEITALLDEHGRALTGRDEKAFTAPFAGAAKASQRTLFKNLLKIPFQTTSFKVISSGGRASDTFGRGATINVDVAFVHQIKGVDVRPVAEWYRWTVEKKPKGRPTVTKVSGSPNAYGESKFVFYPGPWDVYSDMHVEKRPHVLITTHAKNAAIARRTADVFERAAADDLNAWRRYGPRDGVTLPGFLIALEPDRKVYNTLFRVALKNDPNEAGFALAMYTFTDDLDDGLPIGGARIAIDTTASRAGLPGGLPYARDVARHEIAHAMVDPLQKPRSSLSSRPATWVVEGFADYMAGRGLPRRQQDALDAVRGRPFDGHLPLDFSFYADDGRARAANYALGTLAMRFMAAKWGDKAVMSLVAAHYAEPGRLHKQIEQATGLSFEAFERQWAAYVRSRIR